MLCVRCDAARSELPNRSELSDLLQDLETGRTLRPAEGQWRMHSLTFHALVLSPACKLTVWLPRALCVVRRAAEYPKLSIKGTD